MKTILYAGMALMIGAGIYGFADYNKTSRDKKFSGMYDDNKTKTVTLPVTITAGETGKTEAVVKPEARKEKKRLAASVKTTAPLPAVKPVTAAEKNSSVNDIHSGQSMTDELVPAGDQAVSEKVKTIKRKKVKTRLFSRAPIREDYEEEVIPETKDIKKTGKKL